MNFIPKNWGKEQVMRISHLFAFLSAAGLLFLAGCGDGSSPTDNGPSNGNRPTLYTYTFSGDIEGILSHVVPADASDPLARVKALQLFGGFSFSFPASSTGNTGICDQKAANLSVTISDWGDYGLKSWAGGLRLLRGSGGILEVEMLGSVQGAGYIRLTIEDVPVEESQLSGRAVVRFVNARAAIQQGSYPFPGAEGDSADRCVNFTITATPQ